jgi:hypothetical protein
MTTQPPIRTTPKEYDPKIWSRHFEAVLSGKKKAEHRVDDRGFQVGDTLMLREVTEPECEYTGRKIYVTITHIITNGEMAILSIEPQDTVQQREIPVVKEIKPCPYVNGLSSDNTDVNFMLKTYRRYSDFVLFENGTPKRCFRFTPQEPVSSLRELRDELDVIASASLEGQGVAGRLQAIITKIDEGKYVG